MGECNGLANMPGGDIRSMRVSFNDRPAKAVFPPSLPVGERAGERGLRGGGEGLPLTLPLVPALT